MKYEELKKYLFSKQNKRFAAFSESLSNSDLKSIGVKTPIIDQLIKVHYKDKDLDLKDFELMEYLEIDSLYFGIGLKRCNTIDEQLSFLDKNLKYATSWAITDTIPKRMKELSYDRFVMFFLSHYNKKQPYVRRFAYVLGLKYYKNVEVLELLPHIKTNEEYPVMMAEAWLLATLAIVYPYQIIDFLNQNISDTQLVRKTISKVCDSYRIPDDIKNNFKKIREQL